MRSQQAVGLLLLLGAAALAHGFPSKGAEFSPSVVLTNLGEMGAPCHQMVQNAINTGAKSIKFVPTVHYWGSERHIDKFCIRDESWSCRDISQDNLRRFTDLLASCMKKAVDAGKDIAILAHLDNMAQYTWRNLLQFAPLEKHGGYSYADVVLRPMAAAANRVAKPGTQIIFTLQGETGKSVSQYSKQWLQLVGTVRNWIRAGKNLGSSDVLISISLNYNKVFGWIEFESITPALISRDMDKAWKEQAPKYPMDLPNMKRLYDAIDVIGVSAYPPLYPDFKASDLEVTLQYHDQELKYAGINLKSLLRSKKLVISEWGVGGGTQDGNSIAPDVTYVSGFPFFGLWYPYATNKDPWRNQAFSNYRRKLYTMTAAWLRKRGGPTYRVDGIYMWNAGSWDAIGVHFATSGNGGSWADPQLQALVKSHNAAVR